MQHKIPDANNLKDCIRILEDQSNSLFLALPKHPDKNKYPYFTGHLTLAIKDVLNTANSIGFLSRYYLNQIYILFRNSMETTVDMFWVYSHEQISPEYIEILSKRFFMISAMAFLKQTETSEWNLENSKFLKSHKEAYNLDAQIALAKKQENISLLFDSKESRKLSTLQKIDWRLIPGYHKSYNEVNFSQRAQFAEKLFRRICTIGKYSFEKDYRSLSKFVHFTSLRFDDKVDEHVGNAIYLRVLNQATCFSAYLIELLLFHYGIEKSKSYREVECILLWP